MIDRHDKIVLTGAAGLVGQNLLVELKAQGYTRLVAIDKHAANLDVLQAMGARLVYFSPLADEPLPACDAVWLPGGYPELHAATLAQGTQCRASLAAHVAAGRGQVGRGVQPQLRDAERLGGLPRLRGAEARVAARHRDLPGHVVRDVPVHRAVPAAGEHALHRFTQRLWAWRDDFGTEAAWAVRLGEFVAAKGADALWPMLSAR